MPKKKKAPKFRVDVSWEFDNRDIDFDFEKGLEKIAKKFGGKESGSGAGFGERDVGYFNFPTKVKAEAAEKALKTAIKKSRRKLVTSSITSDEDE